MNAPFAGTLRDRIFIERPVYSKEGSGERVVVDWEPAWEPDGGVWSRVRAQTGKNEAVVSGGLMAIASYDIEMRYRTDITAEMSVVLPNGLRLDILTEPVDPDGTLERTMLRCEYRGGEA